MAILQGIHATCSSPFMDTLMPIVTTMGENGFIWLVIALVLLANKRTRQWGFVMIAALIVDLVCVQVLKSLVARPRPFMADPSIQLLIDPPEGGSFPSGHTSASFCAAVVLLFAPVKKVWKGMGIVLASLIAFSRLYLEVHYPTDVLGGLLIGVAVAVAVCLIYRRWSERHAGLPGSGTPTGGGKAVRGAHAR